MTPRSSRPWLRILPRAEVLEDRTVPTAGTLDASFGIGGHVLLDPVAFSSERAESVAVQPDGKILVAGFAVDGTAAPGFPTRIRVSRLHPNGTLDSTFDGDGSILLDPVVAVDLFSLVDDTVGLILQPDGQILVASTLVQGDGNLDWVVARLNGQDGSLDASFGTGGIATVDFNLPGAGSVDRFRAMTLDNQGRIVLAGMASSTNGPWNFHYDIAVARLTAANGALDPTFGTGGRQTIDFDEGADFGVTGVALQGDGIIVSGYNAAGSGSSSFAVVRLTEIGALDPTFGVEGRQTVSFDNFGRSNSAQALVVQPWDNKIVLAGPSFVGAGASDFVLARLDANGSLDPTFGDGGRQTTIRFSNDLTNDRPLAMVLQPDRKIVVAGYSHQQLGPPAEFGFAALRLNENGQLDASFGNGGQQDFVFPFPAERGAEVDDKVYAVAVQPDGRIVLAGHFSSTPGGGIRMALARLHATTPFVPRQTVSPPAQPSPPPLPRGIAARLIRKGKKGKTRLYLQLAYADTGELIWERVSPYQPPRYRGMLLTPTDQNGDGVMEMAMFTARQEKKVVRQLLTA